MSTIQPLPRIFTDPPTAATGRLLLPAPRVRTVLGLPPGSIRALLTLMTVGFIVAQTARGQQIGLLWFESLMIVLAHYFAHRRFVALSPEVRAQLKAASLIEDEPYPLYLPRRSLPTIIVLAFIGLAAYLAWQGRLRDRAALPVFISVGAYFLGIGFGAFVAWWTRHKPRVEASWFADLKAIVTLTAVALEIIIQLGGWQHAIPYVDKLEGLPLALMLFYFGSR